MKLLVRLVATLLVVLCAGAALVACGSDDEPERQGVSLPSDFPESAVPLVDGALMAASGSAPKWQVTVQANAADGNSLENAVRKLTDAGFEESSRSDGTAAKNVLLSKDDDGKQLWVNVGLSADAAAGGSTVIYQVSRVG